MAVSYELVLPEEMWEFVMEFLPPSDLCQLALSSTYFYSVATSTKLWSRISIDHLSLSKVMSEGLIALFQVTRFNQIKHLDLSVTRSVNHSLFRLPTVQFNDLFDLIIEAHCWGALTITSLNLKHENLSEVNEHKLSMAVTFLHRVDLSYTRLSRLQCNVLVSSIEYRNTHLQELNLSGVFLSHVPSIHLARAVNSLKSVDLSWSRLTVDQCFAILSLSVFSSSVPSILSHLTLEGVNLYSETDRVPLQLLFSAGQRLCKINLSNARVTTDQYEALLEGSLGSNKLMELNLENAYAPSDAYSLREVAGPLLARAVSRLTKCDLSGCILDTDQLTSLFSAITSSSSSTLTHLSLDCVNLSGVDADLLADAVASLRSVDLSATSLSSAQVTVVLEECVASKQLGSMQVKFVNLMEAPRDLVEKARDKFRLY